MSRKERLLMPETVYIPMIACRWKQNHLLIVLTFRSNQCLAIEVSSIPVDEGIRTLCRHVCASAHAFTCYHMLSHYADYCSPLLQFQAHDSHHQIWVPSTCHHRTLTCYSRCGIMPESKSNLKASHIWSSKLPLLSKYVHGCHENLPTQKSQTST